MEPQQYQPNSQTSGHDQNGVSQPSFELTENDNLESDSDEETSPASQGTMDLIIPSGSDLRRLALESTDTLEVLAAKSNSAAGPAADKARSLFVTTWLMETYETYEDHNIRRSTVYSHYLKVCQQQGVRPVNSATFGKLIKPVFPDLKTRRLGTRGQSKYHYCGIRLREHDNVNDAQGGRMDAQEGISEQGTCENVGITNDPSVGPSHDSYQASNSPSFSQAATGYDSFETDTAQFSNHHNGVSLLQQQPSSIISTENASEMYNSQFQIPLNSTLVSEDKITRLPEFMPIEGTLGPAIDMSTMRGLMAIYRAHLQGIFDTIQMMKLLEVETLIKKFWQELSQEYRELTGHPEVTEHISRADSVLYDTVMHALLPNPLQVLPVPVIQSLRQFARQLESWIISALIGYSQTLCTRKVEVARPFISNLRRHTSLNHLAQAAIQVLEHSEIVSQMLADWQRIDFDFIREQGQLVGECSKGDPVQIMENDFKRLLANGSKLDHWTGWLETILGRFLDESQHLDPSKYVSQARQFLLKWSFYSNLIIRDLTMKSAMSFGSFHIMRLFYDEYIFYSVEQRIKLQQQTPSLQHSLGNLLTNGQTW